METQSEMDACHPVKKMVLPAMKLFEIFHLIPFQFLNPLNSALFGAQLCMFDVSCHQFARFVSLTMNVSIFENTLSTAGWGLLQE